MNFLAILNGARTIQPAVVTVRYVTIVAATTSGLPMYFFCKYLKCDIVRNGKSGKPWKCCTSQYEFAVREYF